MYDAQRLRVLRVYHGARSSAHRSRERIIAESGIDMTLVVPSFWPEPNAELSITEGAFSVVEVSVTRPGDVNRHRYEPTERLRDLIRDFRPQVLDIHEEPFSLAAHQWLRLVPSDVPVVMYTAQNIDKRFPPPFTRYERLAHRRVAAFYPCSRQAAAVARGKGFEGHLEVLPLGYDDSRFRPGTQSSDDGEVVLALVGRLVPEKGTVDAIRTLGALSRVRPARLVIMGNGPEEAHLLRLAAELGLRDRIELVPWRSPVELSEMYRAAHVVLVPSHHTAGWVEQFGRVIVEAQASGALVAGYASGSIPEVAGAPGILVEVGAVEELAIDIATVLHDREEYSRRREGGIRLSQERTWRRVAEQHADLYRQVAAGATSNTSLPLSPRQRRALARAEFGETAPTAAGVRPFALPILRRGGRTVEALGSILDGNAELAAWVRRR